jgi:hypothetical protein
MFWDEARLGALRDLLAQGFSASGAGQQLGCSRNAVIGVAHRNHIPLDGGHGGGHRVRSDNPISATATRPRSGRPRSPNAIKTLPIVQPAAAEPAALKSEIGLHITLVEATSLQCRWGHGDPCVDSYHVCAHATVKGSAWCEHHYSRVYNFGAAQRIRNHRAA